MKRISLLVLFSIAAAAQSVIYVEDYEVVPPSLGPPIYSMIRTSPHGVVYDFFPGRAFPRLAPEPINVLGDGDEGFVWAKSGVNAPAPDPFFGEPGVSYCDDNNTGYLVNGYGTGYQNWTLGMNFSHGPTRVHSLDFGYASGSNAPTTAVRIQGFTDGVQKFEVGAGVGYGTLSHIGLPNFLVDRIEIVRTQNINPFFSRFSLGWYTVDNIAFDVDPNDPFGQYSWTLTDGGLIGPVPEPASLIALAAGVAVLLRKRRS